ncbi:putative XS domain-containing protein [Helianthus annuus]|nr:factor of DNA methylation 4 [Helianthus annuus]XP_022037289.1 factor of DNA methylation 4 [Helianthus annuus]KAF5804530.1 putative XS domain-containing protein [Helianthus annuus]KAJ0569140.1 putative XS domain-containing protein [Helianthus annuus]KAJ0583436.1 putative XS domain-containing protein [Helianthus annuus]KAJ0749176.1 putative XS domain-containing protein [Helianthus annuus]KAJ0917590.1 putative XS domain-containing protein [Helianthus annuus]
MSQRVRYENKVDPEFEENVRHKYYEKLKDGCLKVRFSDKFLKCPFCHESKDYSYNDLLRHADRIASKSKTTSYKEKAKHTGLIEYLERDFHAKIKCFDSTSVNLTPNRNANEELIVWPWMAVVSNIPVEYKNDCGKKLTADWITEGYSPVEDHLLLKWHGFSGLAVVEFGKTWDGFYHVMKFIKAFEVNKHGRKDWFDREKCKDDKLYAWIATAEDYNRDGVIGDYLRKNGDLKTVADVQKEDESVICGLKAMIHERDKRTEEMNDKISKIDVQLETAMKQKEVMTENFNRDKEIMQKATEELLKMITDEHERTKRRLEEREKGLKAREAINEIEQRKLDDEKRMIELEVLEQNKTNERGLKLAVDLKREKEKIHQKIIELQKKLDEKQCLELRIKQMKEALEVIKHMTDEHHKAKNKLESIQNDLRVKEEELEDLEFLNQSLKVKERISNDELVESRKELIYGLSGNTSHARVFVKRMGELDEKPFIAAAKRHCSNKREGLKYGERVASVWENHLRDTSWHPFKVITVEGIRKEILDEEDEKIVSLKNEYDKDVYDAVVTALNELNEYNPIGRYPVAVLWNKKLERPATLKEGVEAVLNQWKIYKHKRLN